MIESVKWEPEIVYNYPNLNLSTLLISRLSIQKSPKEITLVEDEFFSQIREKFTLENIKDDQRIRAYRDFYWQIKIDPTKTRPAAEALIRRILANKPLWRINTFVDAYNISSAASRVTLGAYDLDSIRGDDKNKIDLIVRRAYHLEEFQGIGMKEPKTLRKREIVVTSGERIISIYPYRDAHHSRIQIKTKNILLIAYGVPQIEESDLKEALNLTINIYKRFDKNFQSSLVQHFHPEPIRKV